MVNQKALEDLVNNPLAMIGVGIMFLMGILFIYGLFTYPSICHYELYESNVTSLAMESGVCKPQEFIDGKPNWQQKILTFGTGNIALVIFVFMVGVPILINKKLNKIPKEDSA